jgi:hypothetical protein
MLSEPSEVDMAEEVMKMVDSLPAVDPDNMDAVLE